MAENVVGDPEEIRPDAERDAYVMYCRGDRHSVVGLIAGEFEAQPIEGGYVGGPDRDLLRRAQGPQVALKLRPERGIVVFEEGEATKEDRKCVRVISLVGEPVRQ